MAAMALQLVLPESLIRGLGNRALIPSLEGLLLITLLIANPGHISKEESRLRVVGLALIALISIANVVSLVELIHALLYGTRTGGRSLVYASVPIWLTNVIVFGLWYWKLDRGGPAKPTTIPAPPAGLPLSADVHTGCVPGMDARLPRLSLTRHLRTRPRQPRPANTMPLTAWAKLLMMVQSLASLVTVAVVISRAVNILG